MIGLVDCNNFFASCERVFNPALRDKPIVVLSNNDGCIIARSNEAKVLGLKMGAPFYQSRWLLEQYGVAVFSSNYVLYGDMSRRVMTLLADLTPGITQYSIDECFVDLSGIDNPQVFGKHIVHTIGRGTGIPVTMGIAPTKTLAKVASRYGKKYQGYEGVCIIDTEEKREKALRGLDIADVWGVGRRSVDKLLFYGVNTAWDLTQKSESWVQRMLTVTGVRTWKELRGEDCIDIDELPHKQTICTSRSFSDQGLDDIHDLEEAVANFTALCSRKLKAQHSCCKSITVFAYTSRFRTDIPSHTINRTIQLPVATSDLQELVAIVIDVLRKDFKKGYFYKKAGEIDWKLCDENLVKTYIFYEVDRDLQRKLSDAIDSINRRNGHNTVRVAVQGTSKKWYIKSEHITKQYTTNLDDIIQVKT